MPKKIVIAAGGTGGHLFPAQALARKIEKEHPDITLSFMAKGLEENPYFDRHFPFYDIPSGTISSHPIESLRGLSSLARGTRRAIRILSVLKPDLVIGFGSYHGAPALAAAAWQHIPYILHEANAIPGRVIRLFSRWALWTGSFFPCGEKSLHGEVRHVSIPLREEFNQMPTRHEALDYFHLDHDKTTCLVFGGSQGAEKINELVGQAAKMLPGNIQLLHFTGKKKPPLGTYYEDLGIRAYTTPFEPNMQFAWAAADAVLARSGASTIAEALFARVPSFLIPFPFGQDRHQEKNGEYVVETIKGGTLLRQDECTPERLGRELQQFLAPDALAEMRNNIDQFYKQSKPKDFYEEVIRTIKP
jgi:UDP-N-acetylglucosamine--N-acetylmuramyl-(pentapeptide) pyrophosphoryl-undecaprenol N-acetylglucosamine transferase